MLESYLSVSLSSLLHTALHTLSFIFLGYLKEYFISTAHIVLDIHKYKIFFFCFCRIVFYLVLFIFRLFVSFFSVLLICWSIFILFLVFLCANHFCGCILSLQHLQRVHIHMESKTKEKKHLYRFHIQIWEYTY